MFCIFSSVSCSSKRVLSMLILKSRSESTSKCSKFSIVSRESSKSSLILAKLSTSLIESRLSLSRLVSTSISVFSSYSASSISVDIASLESSSGISISMDISSSSSSKKISVSFISCLSSSKLNWIVSSSSISVSIEVSIEVSVLSSIIASVSAFSRIISSSSILRSFSLEGMDSSSISD